MLHLIIPSFCQCWFILCKIPRLTHAETDRHTHTHVLYQINPPKEGACAQLPKTKKKKRKSRSHVQQQRAACREKEGNLLGVI